MTVYNVVPKGPGRSGWKVEANGRVTSRHNKKATAKRAVMRRAESGDTVVIHGADGKVMNRRTVR